MRTSFRYIFTGISITILFVSATPAVALVVLPGIPDPLPAVGNGNSLSALRVKTSGSTFAWGELAGSTVSRDGFNETETLFTEDYHDTAALSHTATSASGGVHVLSLANGSAGFGKLRGSALAFNTLDNTVGFFDVTTSVAVEFLDVFTVAAGGGPKPNFKVQWSVDGSATSVPLGSASADTQLWMFPFGPFPQPGANFSGIAYHSDTRLPGSAPFVIDIGDTNPETGAVIFAPGRYWIYGRVDLFATRVADSPNQFGFQGASSADFLDTITLSITPDESTPDATFTTNSGYDYAPLPEPATWTLLGLGLPALFGLSRPRRHMRCSEQAPRSLSFGR
jgi:hypothetical protein